MSDSDPKSESDEMDSSTITMAKANLDLLSLITPKQEKHLRSSHSNHSERGEDETIAIGPSSLTFLDNSNEEISTNQGQLMLDDAMGQVKSTTDLPSNRGDSEMAAISQTEEHLETLQETILLHPPNEDVSMDSREMVEESINLGETFAGTAEPSQLKPPTPEYGSSESTYIPGMSLASRRAWQRLEEELSQILLLDDEIQDESNIYHSNISLDAAASEGELQTVAVARGHAPESCYDTLPLEKAPLSEKPTRQISTEGGLKRDCDVCDELDDKKPSARK